MATNSEPLDVQKLLVGAGKLEISLLSAGIETMQVYLNEASRFTELAAEVLKAAQDDKASLAETARKVKSFGQQSLRTYADLAQRLSTRYYEGLDRIADGTQKRDVDTTSAPRSATTKRTASRKRAVPAKRTASTKGAAPAKRAARRRQ
jgi:hypothetical protein